MTSAPAPPREAAGAQLRPVRLPDDLDALLRLEAAASAASTAYVHAQPKDARAFRAALVRRGAAEFGPPHARFVALPGAPAAGLLAVLDAPALARARLLTALAVRRGEVPLSAVVQGRMHRLGATLAPVEAGTAYLSRLAVAPEVAGRGLGRWLVAQAVDRARALDAAHLVVDVAADNARALALYESAGFTRLGGGTAHDGADGRAVSHVRLGRPVP